MDPILIVDDEKDNLQALQRLLRNLYDVKVTTSPFEALKWVRTEAYHVIISDQRMAEMSGVEFLEKVKNVAPAATRILLTGYTEIESVIGAINRGHIYRYIAKPWDPEELKQILRQANEAYQLRTELDRKNLELSSALAQLQTLERAKDRFLALISHELNTPLTVLQSYLGLLTEKRAEFPAETQKILGGVEGGVKRFSEIVSEVLTYVRLESEGEFTAGEFFLRAETLLLKEALAPMLKAKNIKIAFDFPSEIPIRCDAEKMRIALQKLVGDAIRHSPSGKEIKLVVRVENGLVLGKVLREGKPVSETAFTPLEISGSVMHHHRDLGLSLAISKWVIEGHGGELSVDPASATTLQFKLPLPI